MAFDLHDVLANRTNVSKLDTGREKIEYIDIGLIDADERNFYALSDIDDLAANIELIGLQQPLRVRTHPDDDTRVVVVSGHRRRAAIRKLVDEGKGELAMIPCIRERDDVSPAMQELRLIYANSDTRTISPADLSRQVARVEELLYQLKEEGVEFPGRMRDHVAEACKISAAKLARLKVIRENLAPELSDSWDKSLISEQAAYAIARMPLDFQQRLVKAVPLKAMLGAYMEQILKLYDEDVRWEPEFTCPDDKTCRHGDSMLRHDVECSSWDQCRGKKCCLDCDKATRSWSPCERACSRAKKLRAENAAKEKEKDEKAEAKRVRGYQKATQKNAARLLKAIDAAGLGDDVKIPWRSYNPVPVATIRKYAAGDFEDSGKWYGSEFEPGHMSDAVALAKQLGCSTDYLYGLTDDLTPGSADEKQDAADMPDGWVPLRWLDVQDKPQKDRQKAVCVVDAVCARGSVFEVCVFVDGEWCYEWNGEPVVDPVVKWFPIPDEN